MAHTVHVEEGEVQDLPFIRNDMKEHTPTMDKPFDAIDAPSRADSEWSRRRQINPGPPPRKP